MGGKKKEMLFILGQFFKKTNRMFSKSVLDVSVSKAEFIDVILSVGAVAKQKRAIYRNLESLQKGKYIIYDDRKLRFSKKGYNEYVKIKTEHMRMKQIEANIATQSIRFKRKIQAKLK